MRPEGATRADSSVRDFPGDGGDGGGGDNSGEYTGGAAGGGVEMVGGGDEAAEGYDGAEVEVSSHCCCGRLSPTAIVYMSAFVSSLTSVLLGYGEPSIWTSAYGPFTHRLA